jgi:Zonular occludens toxin (Zot)
VVEGYDGRPGAGKTCSMVWRAWQQHERFGREVYANIPLIDRRPESRTYGKSWGAGDRLRTLDEALKLDNCLILLDEVHVWAPSQEWQNIPPEMKIWLAQHRKNGLDIWWTAQSSARVYNVIRELTATCWSASRFGPLTILKGRDPETKEDLGKKYLLIRPEIYNLYDTAYMVGTRDGDGAGRGTALRYAANTTDHPVTALLRRNVDGEFRYEWATGHIRDLETRGDVIQLREKSSERTKPRWNPFASLRVGR